MSVYTDMRVNSAWKHSQKIRNKVGENKKKIGDNVSENQSQK